MKKTAKLVLGLILFSSTVFAQSLADAKKAVNAEQYQKAKSILKNLTTTQASNPENFFWLGDAYLRTDKVDSAKMAFTKGISADAEYNLNYVGLGTIDLIAKNDAAAQANFNKALDDTKKKEYLELMYIGKAYTYEQVKNFPKALEFLNKAKEKEAAQKDPELFVAFGDVYMMQGKNSEAVAAYNQALAINNTLTRAEVKIGEIWRQAYNFELSEKTLQAVIAKDPNFGPAYRAQAENYYRWASQFPNRRAELLPKAKDLYGKYLNLTDRSVESQYRYLIFLLNAQDFATLEKEASAFVAKNGTNKDYVLAKRFLAYAQIENKKTDEGSKTLEDFVKSRDQKGIIADDYLYLGKALQDQKKDSLAVGYFIKAYELDTSKSEIVSSIAKSYYSSKNYEKAAEFYDKIATNPKTTMLDYYYAGLANYFYYYQLVENKKDTPELTSKVLVKADSAFTKVATKTSTPEAYLYRGKVLRLQDPEDQKGLGIPSYEKFIELVMAKPETVEKQKRNLVEAYSVLGAYYIKTDKPKASDYFKKVLELEPENKLAQDAIKAIAAK